MDGIASVLNAARVEPDSGTSGMGDKILAQQLECPPTVEEYIQQGAQEIASAPESSVKKPGKRGRPKGSKNNSPAPDAISGEDRTRAYVQKLGENQAVDIRAMELRKKITKAFNYFPHKLSRYYANVPNVALLSTQQLIDTDQLLMNILDEGDEAIYVKEGFKFVAKCIESNGPAFQSRFLSWMPGSDILQCQQGLTETVGVLVDETGPNGLADDVNRISLDFIGWAPSNPYVNAALNIFRVMQAVQQAKIMAPMPTPTGPDPLQNI